MFPEQPRVNATLEKEMATHSSILAWRTPWTQEHGGLQSMGSQGVRHNWATNTFTFFLSQLNFSLFIDWCDSSTIKYKLRKVLHYRQTKRKHHIVGSFSYLSVLNATFIKQARQWWTNRASDCRPTLSTKLIQRQYSIALQSKRLFLHFFRTVVVLELTENLFASYAGFNANCS